jgi:hypothetical protein
VPLRFWWLAVSPHRVRITLEQEWPRLRAGLVAGRLVPLGLVRNPSPNPFRLTHNHQVLAYSCQATPGHVAIRIYDPNWPDRDDVTIVVDRPGQADGATLHQGTGEPLAAFFVAPYSHRPVAAWRRPSARRARSTPAGPDRTMIRTMVAER